MRYENKFSLLEIQLIHYLLIIYLYLSIISNPNMKKNNYYYQYYLKTLIILSFH